MPRLSQETIAMLVVGIGLAALIFTGTSGLRGEIQAVRGEMRAIQVEMRAEMQFVQSEIRDVRTEAHADREVLRAEARADREALRTEARADRETFERHIIRLTEQQGILSGHIESIRNQLATAR